MFSVRGVTESERAGLVRTRKSRDFTLRRTRRRCRKLGLELLEDRRLLANWSGDIPDGTVWSTGQTQVITADARVPQGSTLTIQPGAVVKLNHCSLTVEGVLNAQGTAGSHIAITSYYDDTVGGNSDGYTLTPYGGDWMSIVFKNASAPSILDYVDVSYGGGDSVNYTRAPGMLYVNGGRLTLTHSMIATSYNQGVRIVGADPTITDTTFRDHVAYGSGSAGISMDLASSPTIRDVTFTGNRINGVKVDGGSLTKNVTWNAAGVSYVVDGGNVTVPKGMMLTLGPGQVVKNNGGYLIVKGTLDARGTAASPIFLTYLQDDTVGGDANNDGGASAPGSGIQITVSSTSVGSVLDYVQSRRAFTGMRIEGATVTISNSRFEQGDTALNADLAAQLNLNNVTLTGNNVNALYLDGGTLTGNHTWGGAGIVYLLDYRVTVAAGATLTIAPGQIIKFKKQSYTSTGLLVLGTLNAVGTAARPIIFTSERDDTAGGDTDHDGGVNSPSAGSWNGISLASNASGTTQVVNHIDVRYSRGLWVG